MLEKNGKRRDRHTLAYSSTTLNHLQTCVDVICKAEQANTPNCPREIRDAAAILQVKGSCFSVFEPSPGVIRVTSLVPNAGTMTDRKNVTIHQNCENPGQAVSYRIRRTLLSTSAYIDTEAASVIRLVTEE